MTAPTINPKQKIYATQKRALSTRIWRYEVARTTPKRLKYLSHLIKSGDKLILHATLSRVGGPWKVHGRQNVKYVGTHLANSELKLLGYYSYKFFFRGSCGLCHFESAPDLSAKFIWGILKFSRYRHDGGIYWGGDRAKMNILKSNSEQSAKKKWRA